MSLTRSLAVAASSFVLVLSGCSVSTSASKPIRSATTLPPVTTVTPDSSDTTLPTDTSGNHHVAETPESRALAKKLVANIDGYELQPDSVGDTGPSDLAKTVDDSGGGSDIQTKLLDDHFIVGYQRYFLKTSEGRGVVVFAYQFGDSTGAKDFAATVVQMGLAPQDGVAPKPLAAPGIPQAAGYQLTTKGVTVHTVVFAKGDYVVLCLTNAKNGDPGSPTAIDVAKQQYGLL